MQRPRLAFLGTPVFAADLLNIIHSENLAEVTSVWTQPDKPSGRGKNLTSSHVKQKALELGIKVHQPDNFKENSWKEILAVEKPDIGFITAYGQLLPENFFNIPRFGMFNLHFSLLPKWRGASPLQSAILAGDKSTGVSLQKIVKEMDRGDLAASAEFELDNLKLTQAFDRSMQCAVPLVRNFLNNFPDSTKNLIKQNEADATFCKKIHKQSGRVFPDYSAAEVMMMSRAYENWPGIFIHINGLKYDLKEVVICDSSMNKPGTIYSPSSGQLFLQLQHGCIQILTIQKEGKKPLAAADFLNGRPFQLPSVIDSRESVF